MRSIKLNKCDLNKYGIIGFKMKKLLLALLLFSASAQAAFIDGNKLLEYAREEERSGTSSGMLLGYIAGVHDAFDNTAICTPSNATLGQLKAVVVKFLKENPEVWAKNGDNVIFLALGRAFPCKK
jgi:hypothetical protein